MKTTTETTKTNEDELVRQEFELPNHSKIVVWHNHPDVIGMSIHDAFENWMVRTSSFTTASFINYVKSKQLPYTILTDQEYKKRSS